MDNMVLQPRVTVNVHPLPVLFHYITISTRNL